ncbi:PIN domain-containing protein [Candidatus Woesearchaeota archaeon]|nr:PIN domain-containing protein [Candidatus Woesearchaeota archaeon]
MKNDKDAIEKVKEIKDSVLITTTINIFEVLLGIHRKKHTTEAELEKFKKLIGNIDILHFDLESSFLASKITADLINQGKEINAMDCLVAGAMMSKNCYSIVTRDKEHFQRIKGIKVEGY